jgi:hypothetical protein
VRPHCLGYTSEIAIPKRNMGELKPKPKYQFRVNGIIIPRLSVHREIVLDTEGDLTPSGKAQIVIHDWHIGAMPLDDNENLWDSDLPKFVIEVRDSSVDALLRGMALVHMCAKHDVPATAQDDEPEALVCPRCGGIPAAMYTLRRGWRHVTIPELLSVLRSGEELRG